MKKATKQKGGRKKGQAEKMLSPEKGVSNNSLLAEFGRVANDPELFLLLEFLAWKVVRRGRSEPYRYFATNGAREIEWESDSISFFREGLQNRLLDFERLCSQAIQRGDTNFFRKVSQILDFLHSDGGKNGAILDRKRYLFAQAYFSCFPRDGVAGTYAPTFREVMEKLADKGEIEPDEKDARQWAKEMGMRLRADKRGPKRER